MTREPDTLSEAQPFKLAGLVWYCWITDRGDVAGAERHEWRTTPRGGSVGRNLGDGSYWALYQGRALGSYPNIKAAMSAVAYVIAREPTRRAA